MRKKVVTAAVIWLMATNNTYRPIRASGFWYFLAYHAPKKVKLVMPAIHNINSSIKSSPVPSARFWMSVSLRRTFITRLGDKINQSLLRLRLRRMARNDRSERLRTEAGTARRAPTGKVFVPFRSARGG